MPCGVTRRNQHMTRKERQNPKNSFEAKPPKNPSTPPTSAAAACQELCIPGPGLLYGAQARGFVTFGSCEWMLALYNSQFIISITARGCVRVVACVAARWLSFSASERASGGASLALALAPALLRLLYGTPFLSADGWRRAERYECEGCQWE